MSQDRHTSRDANKGMHRDWGQTHEGHAQCPPTDAGLLQEGLTDLPLVAPRETDSGSVQTKRNTAQASESPLVKELVSRGHKPVAYWKPLASEASLLLASSSDL